MNERGSFYRKLVYGVVIAVLLFPLSLLSAPTTVVSEGGVLAKLRTQNQLSQSNLGEIDPASETMKLATLGLRGVAVNLLWEMANEYKKKEDWTNLTATLEQLAKLQPNFITFWKFQSWNLSYNVSVEFDDYHDRYYYVRRGIQFLQQGARYNRDNPELLWELGWVNGQKVGRSDEREQYRRLYKADDEFHPADRPPDRRDNWLVGKGYYEDSIAAVDEKGQSLGRKSPAIFYSSPAKSQMNYAEAIETEGLFERGVAAWRLAGKEWTDFGNMPIEHSTGRILYFNEEDDLAERVEELEDELDGMHEGIKQLLAEDLMASLTDEERSAVETPRRQRGPAQDALVHGVLRRLRVSPLDIAARIGEERPEMAREAAAVAAELVDTKELLTFTRLYNDTCNFDYWAVRCEFEQTVDAVQAREKIYRGQREFRENGDPITARKLYEEAFEGWRAVFDEYPQLNDGMDTTGDDVMDLIYQYGKILDQLDERIPEDFPLWDVIEYYDDEREFTQQVVERRERLGLRDDQNAFGAPLDPEIGSLPFAGPVRSSEPSTDEASSDDASETQDAVDEQPEGEIEADADAADEPAPTDASYDSQDGGAEGGVSDQNGTEASEQADDANANANADSDAVTETATDDAVEEAVNAASDAE
ncbi:hypothetical protein Mal64_09550 [Pseudobythopirellula maris]|uniref:IRE (Iron responsive element) n=1 Tax=Pseudobythopirellula maris TaxID=2527991 RepID=A0A5C5ZSP3_9BACT|nr:hypothetical protein [Pseudobythopirellula maris]TWT90562.1 hypothetical protein Mal64_09550 [Pseudobythopirellula maris]